MWVYLLVLLLALALADKISRECKELYQANDPRPCCSIPTLLHDEEFKSECKTRCDSTPDDTCCPLDCLLEVSGIFVDGKVDQKNAEKAHLAMAEKYGDAMKEWKSIFDKTGSECAEIYKGENIPATTCLSGYLVRYSDCLRQGDFLNCLRFNTSKSCEAVKTFVESQDKCGYSTGDYFVVDSLFWRYLEPVDES